MCDPERARHTLPQVPPESLSDWENEGGSLSERLTEQSGAGRRSSGILCSESPLLDAVTLGVLITNCEGEIIYSNSAGQELYATTASELLGESWRHGIDPRDRDAVNACWQDNDPAARPVKFEARMITRSGRRIWTRHSISSLGVEGPRGSHIHIIEDVTRVKAIERARSAALEVLSRERERARVTLECIGDAVISTNARGQVTYLNPVAERLTGWRREDADGQPLERVFKVIDSDTGRLIQDPAYMAMDQLGVVQMPENSLLQRPDGSELAIEDSAAPILDRAGRMTGAVVIFRDRRLSRENTARMAYLARHDSLTGLPNRVAFAEHFNQALKLARRHNKQVGVLFIDLDQFKQVNDALGHKGGDRLLREVARNLSTCVRSTDVVCRYGGDEFVILLGEINARQDASRVAVKVQGAAARTRKVRGDSTGLTMSIGISIYPDDGNDMETLLDRADTAMYHAKLESGKDYCFHYAGMEPSSLGSVNVVERSDGRVSSRR